MKAISKWFVILIFSIFVSYIQVSLSNIDESKSVINKLAETGISLDEITRQLKIDGVESFKDSFRQLIKVLREKQSSILESV